MASPGLSSTIILSEIIFLESSLIIGAGIYLFLKAKKKSKKLTDALKSFSDSENKRLSILTETFQKPSNIDDGKYGDILKNIITNEDNLFKSMANIIYQRDLDLIDKFGEEIEAITQPCKSLFSNDQQPTEEAVEEAPIIDVDGAIDDLLSDDTDSDADSENNENSDVEKDPAFDLSGESEEIPSGQGDDEIAEIPSELLDGGISDITEEFDIDQEKNPASDKPNSSK